MADTEALIDSAATTISSQKNVIDYAIEAVDRAVSMAPGDIGSDDIDLYVLAVIDRIRLSALEAAHSLLYPQV